MWRFALDALPGRDFSDLRSSEIIGSKSELVKSRVVLKLPSEVMYVYIWHQRSHCNLTTTPLTTAIRMWDVVVMIVCMCFAPRCRIMYMK
jgi:hypothetical protein